MSDSYYKNRVIWITGASSGIGRECTVEFANRGARVAVSARSEEKLDELCREIGTDKCLPVPLDVTDLDATHKAVETILQKYGQIDTAFFNAGYWDAMDLPEFDVENFRKTMEVNFMGMVNGINAVLPHFMAGKRKHLVGMSSSVAYRGLPRAEAYCASKAAVRAMLQGLRCQLKPRNVPVSIVLPGFVKSELTAKNDFDMPFLMETEDAAEIIADGIAARKSEIAFPTPFIAMMKSMQALPDSAYTSLMAKKMVRS